MQLVNGPYAFDSYTLSQAASPATYTITEPNRGFNFYVGDTGLSQTYLYPSAPAGEAAPVCVITADLGSSFGDSAPLSCTAFGRSDFISCPGAGLDLQTFFGDIASAPAYGLHTCEVLNLQVVCLNGYA